MKTLTVKRHEWLRGQDGNSSELLDENGCSDIIGHCMRRINNVTQDRLRGELFPDAVFNGPSLFTDNKGVHNSFAMQCMHFNDSSALSDPVRERRLTQLFEEENIRLTFVD